MIVHIVHGDDMIHGVFLNEDRAKMFSDLYRTSDTEVTSAEVDQMSVEDGFEFLVAMRADGTGAYAELACEYPRESLPIGPSVIMDGWYDDEPEPTYEDVFWAPTREHAIVMGHKVRQYLQRSGAWDENLAASMKEAASEGAAD